MKKLIPIIVLTVACFFLQSCVVSQNRVHTDFFDNPEFRTNSTFVSVNVPTFLAKSYIKNALREDDENKDVINLIRKVSDIKVLIIEQTKSPINTDFQNYLAKNNYQEWMSVKQKGQQISINAKQTKNGINRMIIRVNDENNQIVFVDVKGKFSSNDISKIINATEKNQIKIN